MRQVDVKCAIVARDDNSFGIEIDIGSLSKEEASQIGEALRDPIRNVLKHIFEMRGLAASYGGAQ